VIPVGYMAKRISKKPDWLQAAQVVDVYSVSGCVSEKFADYIDYWKHNGYWLFDSPEVIRDLARRTQLNLKEHRSSITKRMRWNSMANLGMPYAREESLPTNVSLPATKQLEGFDVVTFSECSPLSCNGVAKELRTNAHCLFDLFEEAYAHLNTGKFKHAEPGPYRIFAVYSVSWPESPNAS
jgi:hypothetical protein